MLSSLQELYQSLESFVAHRHRTWLRNRQPLERKWRQNLADYHPYEASFAKWKELEKTEKQKSDTKICIAKNKALTAKAIICDTLFKGGRVQFMLTPDVDEEALQPGAADMGMDMGMDPGMTGMLDEVGMMPPGDPEATDTRQRADTVNEDELLIHRQLDLCDAVEELSLAVLSGSVYGIAFAKRHVKEHRHRAAQEMAPGVATVVDEVEVHPAIEYKSPWRMIWDIESGASLRDGAGVFESDAYSIWQLAELANDPAYSESQIRKVIDGRLDRKDAAGTGSSPDSPDPRQEKIAESEKSFTALEFWGQAPAHLVEHFESHWRTIQAEDGADPGPADEPEDDLRKHRMVEIMCVMVLQSGATNDGTIIRFERTQRWDRPFYSTEWETVLDDISAISVVDNLHQIQKVLTGGVRNLEENAKRIANLTTFTKPELLVERGVGELEPGKDYKLAEECKDARQAHSQLVYQDITTPLQNLLSLFMNFADVFSHVPKAQQGQQENTPQTAFELQERLRLGSQYLGDVIRNYDRMVEDIVRDMYFFNLLDETRPTKERYRVKALGYSSFIDRTERLDKVLQALSMALQYEDLKSMTRIRYLWEEYNKSIDLDPQEIIKSPGEMREEAAARQAELSANPPPDPAMQAQQAATIRNLLAMAAEREAGARLKEAKAQEANRKSVRDDAKVVSQLEREQAEAAAVEEAMIPPAVPADMPLV